MHVDADIRSFEVDRGALALCIADRVHDRVLRQAGEKVRGARGGVGTGDRDGRGRGGPQVGVPVDAAHAFVERVRVRRLEADEGPYDPARDPRVHARSISVLER